jgi:hypothetical protein
MHDEKNLIVDSITIGSGDCQTVINASGIHIFDSATGSRMRIFIDDGTPSVWLTKGDALLGLGCGKLPAIIAAAGGEKVEISRGGILATNSDGFCGLFPSGIGLENKVEKAMLTPHDLRYVCKLRRDGLLTLPFSRPTSRIGRVLRRLACWLAQFRFSWRLSRLVRRGR